MSARKTIGELLLPSAEGKKLDPAEEARQRLDGTYSVGSLDMIAETIGIVRMPGESDEALRERCKQLYSGRR